MAWAMMRAAEVDDLKAINTCKKHAKRCEKSTQKIIDDCV